MHIAARATGAHSATVQAGGQISAAVDWSNESEKSREVES